MQCPRCYTHDAYFIILSEVSGDIASGGEVQWERSLVSSLQNKSHLFTTSHTSLIPRAACTSPPLASYPGFYHLQPGYKAIFFPNLC